MKETKVAVINNQKEKLVGLQTLPSTKKEKYRTTKGRNKFGDLFPTVVLVHGFGVTNREYGMFDNLAKALSEAGFLVFRFDFSGRGESEGDYNRTSLSKQKSDLSKILEFVRSQTNVDKSRIGILAQSFGTAVTVALAPKVKSIILMGSVAHPKEINGNPSKWDKLDKHGVSKKKNSAGQTITIGPQFWRDMDNYNLPELIKKIECPILFIHGSEDERVPLSEMQTYFEKANQPKEKIIIEGANHGLVPHRDKMYKIAVEWFSRWLL